MNLSFLQSNSIPALQETINFAQARHQVLVGNVANQGVPGYRVRDLSVESFQSRLKEAIEAARLQSQPPSPGALSPTALADDPAAGMRDVRASLKDILYHDDSDVSLEKQVNEISKNQILHNVAITILSQQFRLLQTAVSERV